MRICVWIAITADYAQKYSLSQMSGGKQNKLLSDKGKIKYFGEGVL